MNKTMNGPQSVRRSAERQIPSIHMFAPIHNNDAGHITQTPETNFDKTHTTPASEYSSIPSTTTSWRAHVVPTASTSIKTISESSNVSTRSSIPSTNRSISKSPSLDAPRTSIQLPKDITFSRISNGTTTTTTIKKYIDHSVPTFNLTSEGHAEISRDYKTHSNENQYIDYYTSMSQEKTVIQETVGFDEEPRSPDVLPKPTPSPEHSPEESGRLDSPTPRDKFKMDISNSFDESRVRAPKSEAWQIPIDDIMGGTPDITTTTTTASLWQPLNHEPPPPPTSAPSPSPPPSTHTAGNDLLDNTTLSRNGRDMNRPRSKSSSKRSSSRSSTSQQSHSATRTNSKNEPKPQPQSQTQSQLDISAPNMVTNSYLSTTTNSSYLQIETPPKQINTFPSSLLLHSGNDEPNPVTKLDWSSPTLNINNKLNPFEMESVLGGIGGMVAEQVRVVINNLLDEVKRLSINPQQQQSDIRKTLEIELRKEYDKEMEERLFVVTEQYAADIEAIKTHAQTLQDKLNGLQKSTTPRQPVANTQRIEKERDSEKQLRIQTERKLETLQDQLNDNKKEINRLKDNERNWKLRLEQQSIELDNLKSILKMKDEEIMKRVSEFEREISFMNERESKYKSEIETWKSCGKDISEVRDQLKGIDEAKLNVVELQTQLASVQRENSNIKELMSIKHQEVSEVQEKLFSKEKETIELRGKLIEKEASIRDLQITLEQLNHCNEELLIENSRLKKELLEQTARDKHEHDLLLLKISELQEETVRLRLSNQDKYTLTTQQQQLPPAVQQQLRELAQLRVREMERERELEELRSLLNSDTSTPQQPTKPPDITRDTPRDVISTRNTSGTMQTTPSSGVSRAVPRITTKRTTGFLSPQPEKPRATIRLVERPSRSTQDWI